MKRKRNEIQDKNSKKKNQATQRLDLLQELLDGGVCCLSSS
jgi:hypothetical protein